MDKNDIEIGTRVRVTREALKPFKPEIRALYHSIRGTVTRIESTCRFGFRVIWDHGDATDWSEEDLESVTDVAKETLEEIRDLARTSLAPMAYSMSEKEWALHRLNRIAGMASKALE